MHTEAVKMHPAINEMRGAFIGPPINKHIAPLPMCPAPQTTRPEQLQNCPLAISGTRGAINAMHHVRCNKRNAPRNQGNAPSVISKIPRGDQ